ncbi:hypothetical protein F4777DRAFT_549730 [Nemania sp. FL0916]|nr:hypothetical protein F4777DRAFT_549730 [Nemania sp. FL0916]
MSWVAHRRVTREEDETYSLLGLFNVNMPMLYGEGRKKAFMRLQEAIYLATRDDSLFLSTLSFSEKNQPLLSDSPARFCRSRTCCLSRSTIPLIFPGAISYSKLIATSNWRPRIHEPIWATYTSSRTEITTTLMLMEFSDVADKLVMLGDLPPPTEITYVAVLNCTLAESPAGALCLLFYGPSIASLFRSRFFPALLPRIEGLEAKLLLRRTLIYCKHYNLDDGTSPGNITSFTLHSNSFRVVAWYAAHTLLAKAVTIEGKPNAEFQVAYMLTKNTRRQLRYQF